MNVSITFTPWFLCSWGSLWLDSICTNSVVEFRMWYFRLFLKRYEVGYARLSSKNLWCYNVIHFSRTQQFTNVLWNGLDLLTVCEVPFEHPDMEELYRNCFTGFPLSCFFENIQNMGDIQREKMQILPRPLLLHRWGEKVILKLEILKVIWDEFSIRWGNKKEWLPEITPLG